MDIASITEHFTGADFAAMGLICNPDLGTRIPGQPAYKLRPRDVSPFLLYWGYMYNVEGKVIPLKQDVTTGQKFGLVSRDQIGRAIVLNGIRVIFYSEALHSASKIAEVCVYGGEELLGVLRTQSIEEAIGFTINLRPDWKEFIEQSILVDMSVLANKDDPETWSQNIHRRLMETTKIQSVTTEVLNIDVSLEHTTESFDAPADAVSTDPRAKLPAWPLDDADFFSASEEVLEPPTRQDRPMIVQLMIEGYTTGLLVPEDVRSEIRRHVGYWLPVHNHRKDDCHNIAHCDSGLELILGLKLSRDAGLDKRNRSSWLDNAFRALKLQIESGTIPKKDGKITCPAVPVNILKIRCAYP